MMNGYVLQGAAEKRTIIKIIQIVYLPKYYTVINSNTVLT